MVSLLLFIQARADQCEGVESLTRGVSVGRPPAAAEISSHTAMPATSKAFSVQEKRHILNSWPHLAPSLP